MGQIPRGKRQKGTQRQEDILVIEKLQGGRGEGRKEREAQGWSISRRMRRLDLLVLYGADE